MRQKEIEKLWIDRIPWFIWLGMDLIAFTINEFLKGNILSIMIQFILHVVGAIMSFIVLEKVSNYLNWQSNKVFKLLSKYSMSMYLFHQQIIYFMITLLNGKVSPYINASANFIVSVIGSFLISWILMKFRGTRFLLGEK